VRLRLFEGDYGRDFGWFVEKDGRRIAALTDPRFEDMFWYSYAVSPLGDTAAERDQIFAREFWNQSGIVYRNRKTGEVVPNAFPGGAVPTKEIPRIWMRGLHTAARPTCAERALLWLKRRRWPSK
jgi:hypothetical protein